MNAGTAVAPTRSPTRSLAGSAGGIPFLNAAWQVARKDILQHLRTKRLLFIAGFMALTLVLVTIVIPLTVLHANRGGDLTHEFPNQAMVFYLIASVFGGMFVIQLLAIVLTSDAVSSEWSNRTIFLLLSKPVSRSAFVLGKFVGALLTVVPTFMVLMALDYVVLGIVGHAPNGDDVGRFVVALLILAVGATAVASMALFFSTLTRSSVTAIILTFTFAFVVFPLVADIGDFTWESDNVRGPDIHHSDFRYDWSHYFSPERVFATAAKVLAKDNANVVGASFVIPTFPPANTGLSVLSGVGFTVLFLVGSLAVVQRRNFE